MNGSQMGLSLAPAEDPAERAEQRRQERDRVLDRLEASVKEDLKAAWYKLEPMVEQKYGAITSPRMIAELIAAGYEEHLKRVDRRFTGSFLRTNRGYRCVGEVQEGSHSRPVKLWVRL